MFSPVIKLPFVRELTNQNINENFTYKLYFDGCSKGNPGPGGAGAVLYKNNEEIWSDCVFVDKNTTNNISEYTGLIIGMTQAFKMGIKSLIVNGDSQLVIKQMKGLYKVKSERLIELHKSAKLLETNFDVIEYNHIFRKDNKRADELCNCGLLKNNL
jgi:ribonuclease HI